MRSFLFLPVTKVFNWVGGVYLKVYQMRYLYIARLRVWGCISKFCCTFTHVNTKLQISEKIALKSSLRRVGDSRWWGSLSMVLARNKVERLAQKCTNFTVDTWIMKRTSNSPISYRLNHFLQLVSFCTPWKN